MTRPNIITVDGEETWLVRQKVAEVISKNFPESRDLMGLEKYSAEKINLEQLTQSLQTPVLMWAPHKLIVLEEPPFLEQSDEAPAWLNLFQNISGGVQLLIVKSGKIDGRKKIGQWLIKNTQYFNFPKINEWETEKFIGFIQDALKPWRYPSEFPMLLFEKVGPDLTLLDAEIKKIKTFAGNEGELKMEMLQTIVSAGVSKHFILGEFLRRADWQAALKHLQGLLQQEAPVAVLGLLAAHFRLFLKLRSMAAQRDSFESMGKALQKNPFYLKRILSEMPARLDLPLLQSIHACLADLDAGYKKGLLTGSLPILNRLAAVWK